MPFPLLRFGDKIIEIAKIMADIITIDAPIGKSVINDNQNPTKQLKMPINGENINIFLKS